MLSVDGPKNAMISKHHQPLFSSFMCLNIGYECKNKGYQWHRCVGAQYSLVLREINKQKRWIYYYWLDAAWLQRSIGLNHWEREYRCKLAILKYEYTGRWFQITGQSTNWWCRGTVQRCERSGAVWGRAVRDRAVVILLTQGLWYTRERLREGRKEVQEGEWQRKMMETFAHTRAHARMHTQTHTRRHTHTDTEIYVGREIYR